MISQIAKNAPRNQIIEIVGTNLIDETGNRYGRLVVIERAGSGNGGSALWRCVCDCGAVNLVIGQNLRRGLIRSCGCLQRELARSRNRKKGQMGTVKRANGDVAWFTTKDGYICAYWPEHLLAASKSKRVSLSWHNFWLHHEKADWVIRARREFGATLHHINGKRDDDRPENLELRWPGKHPKGWTTEAMIETLEMLGYRVDKDAAS